MSPLRSSILVLGALGVAACGDGESSKKSDPGDASTKPATYTWHRDVLPIVQRQCRGCHSPEGVAFAWLDTYLDAAGLAKLGTLTEVIESDRMPPWPPGDECIPLHGKRKMPPEEKAILMTWIDEGAPEGDPADVGPDQTPPLPSLDRVDAELRTEGDYFIPEELVNDFRCYVLDPELATNVDVVGFEIEARARDRVHLIDVHRVDLAAAQARDALDADPGWPCENGPGVPVGDRVAVWQAGTFATMFPAGTGIPVAAGDGLLLQVHYGALRVGTPPDQITVRFQYADTRLVARAQIVEMSGPFQIPPETIDHTVSITRRVGDLGSGLDQGATLWGLAPHMHTLGKRYAARLTGATSECLLDIETWRPRWQPIYFFDRASGLAAAADDEVELKCTWDNSFIEPIDSGVAREAERCQAYLYVTP